MHGLDGRLALHHAHAARRPAEDEVRIEALARHGVVARAGGVIHGQNDLGNLRRRHRFHEARTGADDAFVFSLGADHEARDILDEQQRDALSIASIDVIRHLLGALRVDDAAKARLLTRAALDEATLICDDADGY